MRRPWLSVHLLVVLILHFSGISQAQTTLSASSSGMAGSGRASVEASDVHTLNPAMLVHLRDRDLHSSMTKDAWTVGITDNDRESIVPAGFSYSQVRSGEGAQEVLSKDMKLTFAGFLGKWVSFGLSGRQNEIIYRGVSWRQVNADTGVSLVATKKLGFAAVAYDFMPGNTELPPLVRLRPRTGFGVNYIPRDFMRIHADLLSTTGNSFSGASTLLGYELEMSDFVLFRLGFADEPEFARQLGTMGMGLDLPRFRLNYGFQAGIKGEFEQRHSVDLGIPF